MKKKVYQSKFVQTALEKELAKLRETIPYDGIIAVHWRPHTQGNLCGEVLGDTIHVYEDNLLDAINTLRHEYLECVITRKMIEPLIEIINVFVGLQAREINREKERIVSSFLKLLKKPKDEVER